MASGFRPMIAFNTGTCVTGGKVAALSMGKAGGAPTIYPDPRGEPELRRELAAYLAIARGIECSPSQIITTAGYSGGLGLTLRVLCLEGRKVWMEDPGFPLTRRGLELARLSLAPIPVDADGIDISGAEGGCNGAEADRQNAKPAGGR